MIFEGRAEPRAHALIPRVIAVANTVDWCAQTPAEAHCQDRHVVFILTFLLRVLPHLRQRFAQPCWQLWWGLDDGTGAADEQSNQAHGEWPHDWQFVGDKVSEYQGLRT